MKTHDKNKVRFGKGSCSPEKLGIETWNNLVTLPEEKTPHTQAELQLEKRLKFTFIKSTSKTVPAQVFISDQTDFLALCRYLPFLINEYRIFFAVELLIKERVQALDQIEIFQGDNLATKQLNFLLDSAVNSHATDIHIESLPEGKRVRFRIDGSLRNIPMKDEIGENLVLKIKLISNMDISQKRVPQDGHFPYISEQGKRFDLRTSTVPAVYGEKIVIRLLPADTVRYSMEKIGLTTRHAEIIRRSIHSKTGMILITGPTGSGKTTTLYAILNELSSDSLNIITIEDPVEYRLDKITQVQVNEKAGISFSSALRSFLRQDPDVILVGEIRDGETARIAARAAQTGHLVLSTLHSNTVFEAINRLKSLGVASEDVSSSLKLLISQRLLPKVCRCKGEHITCKDCNGGGVTGRIPIMELLEATSPIKSLLSYGKPISEIENTAKAAGFISMRNYGEKLVETGKIKSIELNKVCPP